MTQAIATVEDPKHAERYPHGECECRDGCGCAGIPGPAAEVVTRGDRRLKVCTRCCLSGDTNREWLITEDSPTEPFKSYDALGLMCAAMYLSQKRDEAAAALPSSTDPEAK